MIFPFRRRKKIITVLEIDNDWLRMVQVKPAAKERKINKIIVEKIISSSEEKISEQISSLSEEGRINSDFLIVCVPYHLVVIRNLELPSANPAEIKDMVELQVGKQTPFTKDELIYDYDILSTNAEGYSMIMLAMVHQGAIGRYLKILEGAGLKTERIALSSEGLIGWHRFACKQALPDKPYVLVNVDYDKSDFMIVLNDKLIFCRNIPLGFSQLKNLKDQEGIRKFIEEIKHSIYAYQNEMIDKEVSNIIITGAEMLNTNLNEAVLRNQLNLSVEIVPQLKNIPQTLESRNRHNVTAGDVSVSSICGLALIYPEQKINLIPPQVQIEKGLKERGRDLYFFGIYLAFILVTISSIFLGRMHNKESYLARLKQETFEIGEKVDKLDNMVKETDGMKSRALEKDLPLNFIYEIHRVILPEIYLTSISFDGGDHVTIRGASKAMSEVFRFLNALEESEHFQNVKTKFVTTNKVDGKDLTEFEIVCPLDKGIKQGMENR